ncbi:hypothetical protein PF005_g28643 [Phytophthora fragariae]|uniref:Uncharacterized protein n=1 Tax=Phytophthora fragariae TaxID=53985 RepID=A0A6A3QHH1_9STRA|nr:hypothetical protein PF009_g29141 [Phytophthora fragariae]KAE8966710.1 hypothetical protein PF011_g27839 [Phytophthora fragariae]KAE9066319.1 hypothetical protein PF007_g28518 [Phytophthora fragariae]KAE9075838.1 hypothetical protein PF006_g28251 [Phytophthora fragariae]KAE9167797.1 hypothetical protein PF005_g28643 [Phytophthora fragariae]
MDGCSAVQPRWITPHSCPTSSISNTLGVLAIKGASWSTADCEGFHKRDLPLVIHAARGTRHVASSSSLHIAGLSESLPRPATTENCCAELNTGDSFVKRENVLQSV